MINYLMKHSSEIIRHAKTFYMKIHQRMIQRTVPMYVQNEAFACQIFVVLVPPDISYNLSGNGKTLIVNWDMLVISGWSIVPQVYVHFKCTQNCYKAIEISYFLLHTRRTHTSLLHYNIIFWSKRKRLIKS